MMYINRRTFVIKRGHLDEAIGLMKKVREDNEADNRIYSMYIGPFDMLAIEIEVESMDAYEKFWSEWFVSEEGKAFGEKWYGLTDQGGTNEIWELV